MTQIINYKIFNPPYSGALMTHAMPGPLVLPLDILDAYSHQDLRLRKGDFVFRQGERPQFFYIVRSGRIRMSTLSEDGKEFIQGYFSAGLSFGEPPLFSDLPYPASASAEESSSIWRCPFAQFLGILREHPDIHLLLTRILSSRLAYKAMMLSELAMEEAEHRLQTILGYVAGQMSTEGTKEMPIPFTRQQLADMTGLRVETVIRILKALARRKVVVIDSKGKVFWKKS